MLREYFGFHHSHSSLFPKKLNIFVIQLYLKKKFRIKFHFFYAFLFYNKIENKLKFDCKVNQSTKYLKFYLNFLNKFLWKEICHFLAWKFSKIWIYKMLLKTRPLILSFGLFPFKENNLTRETIHDIFLWNFRKKLDFC